MNFLSRMLSRLARTSLLFTLAIGSAVASAQTVTYFHDDASGTPVLATDANGNVVWKENYRPYGERLNNQPASANNKLWFAGKPYDASAGLSYMGARYYDPVIRRFMGIDPEAFDPDNFHSFNRYTYANNNPYRYVDPDGKSAITIVDETNLGRRSSAEPLGVPRGLDGGPVRQSLEASRADLQQLRADTAAREAAREITLSRKLHGEAAEHAADAIKAGKPDVLTIERTRAKANRQASTGSLDAVANKHLDEYPPAMFKEGGAGASVRPINPRDNMSAGACIGNACRGLPDGTRVRIKVGE